jgi:hypothetical protein
VCICVCGDYKCVYVYIVGTFVSMCICLVHVCLCVCGEYMCVYVFVVGTSVSMIMW